MQFTLLLVLLPIIIIVASQSPPIAKPGCMDHCGDVSIPFPFGTDERCYHSQGFWVTCHQSSGSPRLLWPNSSNIEIKSISLSGQMRIMAFIAYDCGRLRSPQTGMTGNAVQPTNPNEAVSGTTYARPADPKKGLRKYSITGRAAVPYGERPTYSSTSSIIDLPANFTFNSTINKFTVVGYAANGYLSGLRNYLTYSTGCRTRDAIEQDLEKGICRGSGCCQTSIPPDAQTANVTVEMDYIYTYNSCTYGFLAEGNAFGFSLGNLTNLVNIQELPVLVDWAIGDLTCKEAKKSSSNYSCISANSTCYEPDTGSGYRCRCEDGYDGNPYLRDGCQDINECHVEPKKYCHHYCINTIGSYECRCRRGYHGDGKVDGSGCTRDELLIVKIVTGIFSGIIFLLLTAWLVSTQQNRRQLRRMMRKHFADNGGIRLQQELAKMKDPAPGLAKKRQSAGTFKIFEQSEMEEATEGFHINKFLGQGGFGRVYKGILRDGREVAIKEPRGVDPNQVDNFITEVIVLSQINHRNVVKLLGCCLERKTPLLVYEFISHGDLSSYIHDPEKAPQLDWTKRLNIAIQTAGALSYLHFETTTKIIHRDIKSDNILLDHNFTAKVSDFGASRLVPLDETQFATHVFGTPGYVDPEFKKTRKLTTESDVYSFGVVLLELLTEKRPIARSNGDNFVDIFLSSMQQPSERESLLFKLVVDHILSEENKDQITKVAELAQRCLNPEVKGRPSMKEVESELMKLVIEVEPIAKKEESELRM